MKKGDPIDVRPQGAASWVRCRIELASTNKRSIAVSADEGLPLLAIDPVSCRQVLVLLAEGEGDGDGDDYLCLHTGRPYEIRELK